MCLKNGRETWVLNQTERKELEGAGDVVLETPGENKLDSAKKQPRNSRRGTLIDGLFVGVRRWKTVRHTLGYPSEKCKSRKSIVGEKPRLTDKSRESEVTEN